MGLSKHTESWLATLAALEKLDLAPVLLNGQPVKPSACYRLSGNPPQVIYNTNCPDDLKTTIETILQQHRTAD